MSNTKRVAIVGGGIAGLALGIALKHLNTQELKWEVYIFDQKPSYTDLNTCHFILWKFGIKGLLELGLGKRLSSISWPIVRFTSLDSATAETLVDWSSLKPDENSDFDYLPPMLGVRETDLLRMMLTSFAGRDDLVHGIDLSVKEANNLNGEVGIEKDLATPDWFDSDGFSGLLPDYYFGFELAGYTVSASYGLVTLSFTNGHEVDCDILVGADGTHSKVRECMLSSRHTNCPPQHAKSCVMQGICRIYYPSVSSPTELVDGTPINLLNKDQLLKLCPDGSAQSFVGEGVSFGVVNLGHGNIGWTLVAHQSKPRAFVDEILIRNAREQIAKATISDRGIGSLGFLAKTTSGGSAEGWILPSSEPVSSRVSTVNPPPPAVNAKEPAVSAAPTESNQSNAPNGSQAEGGEPKLPSLEFDPTDKKLEPKEIIELALALAMKDKTLPKEMFSLIAGSDQRTVLITDNVDLAEEPPKNYISPNFHPGRVILIGDAAHACATNSYGSVGASLAICDAVTLAKLLGYAFSSAGIDKILSETKKQDELDVILLEYVGKKYQELRLNVCQQHMYDARAVVLWKRQPEGFWKSMTKMSVGYTWAKSTFQQMQTVGGVDLPQDIVWPKLYGK